VRFNCDTKDIRQLSIILWRGYFGGVEITGGRETGGAALFDTSIPSNAKCAVRKNLDG
jgi:hypothetical protein